MLKYKYQKELDLLLLNLPFPEVINIQEGKVGYRFVKKEDLPNSFKPPSILKPERELKSYKKISGYALSFYEETENAKSQYESCKKLCKNIKKSMGDSLGRIILSNTDGMITIPD